MKLNKPDKNFLIIFGIFIGIVLMIFYTYTIIFFSNCMCENYCIKEQLKPFEENFNIRNQMLNDTKTSKNWYFSK